MRLALAALALVPVGLAPDPAPVIPCLGLGMDEKQTVACIRREVERELSARPPRPELVGPPIWLCNRPECHAHMGVYITPAPSPAAVKALFARAEAARRKGALK